MAFKKNANNQVVSKNPALHFKTLTKRDYPDVMPHQKVMLEQYADGFDGASDVAIQLPTGSGKTLVGLLIADWRRIKNREKVVYLCPTKQLVYQTAQQARDKYGIDVAEFVGPKDGFSPAAKTSYTTAANVAVATYSAMFNTHTYFHDPDVIIVDDAHAAENYIAGMWSLSLAAGTVAHKAVSTFLQGHIHPQDYSRLIGDWSGSSDADWVEKIPNPQLIELSDQLVEIIDAHAGRSNPDLHFKWSLLRDHLDACNMYLGSREILIRPLIPPTFSHSAFANAKHRVFMSATLGEGGDLERLTGRKQILRLSAPEDFQSAGVGRRFFMFPSLSLTGEAAQNLMTRLQKQAGRSVVITPSSIQADAHIERIETALADFNVYDKADIEEDKSNFTSDNRAIAVLANRYDGIDFPNDECRLLCIDGLPKAMNGQERFLMSKMGASALYHERVQTRVLQAVGRCTRGLQDRSAVFVTGTELVDFLVSAQSSKHLYPEIKAELRFGVDQSSGVSELDLEENFQIFIENSGDWAEADYQIRELMGGFEKLPFPAMENLSQIVKDEIAYQEAMWNKDYATALQSARTVLGGIEHPDLRGYRALWLYMAGCAALKLSETDGQGQEDAARDFFNKAKSAAPTVSWLNVLARTVGVPRQDESSEASIDVLKQVEGIEQCFVSMGVTTNGKFEKAAEQVMSQLIDPETFESAQVQLGRLLGLSAYNSEVDGAPDPWWLGHGVGIVFEDHANAEKDSVLGAVKARQAAGHPNWIKQNVKGAEGMEIFPVLVTPCSSAMTGAQPHLGNVRYWELSEFMNWAAKAVGVLRTLKGTFHGEADLVWRIEAVSLLEANNLTLEKILGSLPMADQSMTVVG